MCKQIMKKEIQDAISAGELAKEELQISFWMVLLRTICFKAKFQMQERILKLEFCM